MTDERFYQPRYVRIGSRGFNPAQVTDWSVNSIGQVTVYLNGGVGDSANMLNFSNNEAEAVRKYFEYNSYVLIGDDRTSEGQPGTADLRPVVQPEYEEEIPF